MNIPRPPLKWPSLLAAAFAFLFAASAAPPPAGTPVLVVDEPAHDFGEVTQGEVLRHAFVLRNAGTADLVIARVQPTCGCTVATPTRTVLAPGETSEIAVTYNSANQSGPQHKRIAVSTNDPRAADFHLAISATVIPELEADPPRVLLKDLAPGQTRRATVTVRNAGRRDLVIRQASCDADGLSVALPGGKPFRGPVDLKRGKKVAFEVTVAYPAETPPRFVHGNLVLTLDDKSPRPFEISVTATGKKTETPR